MCQFTILYCDIPEALLSNPMKYTNGNMDAPLTQLLHTKHHSLDLDAHS